MPEHVLHDFIFPIPSCAQTTCLAVVLELFETSQCERLVVVDEQQHPIGVIYAARLMPYLMRSYTVLDVKQTLSALDVALVEPIAILPADLSVEQFGFHLRQNSQLNTRFDWALLDSFGRYLGLLDSVHLLRFWALGNTNEHVGKPAGNYCFERPSLQTLVQLLELLPWPLMLQSSAGQIVTQNPAWSQQFNALSDPEAVRHEVEVILTSCFASQDVKHSLQDISGYPKANFSCLPVLDSPVTRCHLGTQPGTCICVWPLENGQERVWQVVKIPLQESGINFPPSIPSTELWLLAATDVTEQQLLESELAVKNADLNQLNRLKDEFLACISHELKTPITAVMGLSTLLKDQALGELNDRQVRYAQLIHQSGRHLMTAVNDILDLTRMETGQMELTLAPVKIATVCDRAIEQARNIHSKNIQFKVSSSGAETPFSHRFSLVIEPGLEYFVADEFRLRQMLVHLISNALKFTKTEGEVGLRVSRWQGWIALTVWDTGIGIPEQKQHLIFQKFQQLESPLTRQFEGTGLGLVLTRALARLHGGDISFLSRQGKGSEFTLLLPTNPLKANADEVGGRQAAFLSLVRRTQHRVGVPSVGEGGIDTCDSSTAGAGSVVLVVEAAPQLIENLTEHLTHLGYRVVIARSGIEALEKARRLQPKAVFLNPLLPMLSGWDVLTLLKSDAVTSQIPVIVTATRAEKERAFSHRADEFLSLPVARQTLRELLYQIQ